MRRMILSVLVMSALFVTGVVSEARAVDQPGVSAPAAPKKHKKLFPAKFKKKKTGPVGTATGTPPAR